MKGNQLKTGIILSYLSLAIGAFVQLFYTPVLIRLLGQNEYGLYTLVGSAVNYLSLFNLGFNGAYLRFYARYRAEENEDALARLNGMFTGIFMAMGMAALLCGLVLSQFTTQIFGDKLLPEEVSKARLLMQILVCNIALTFPSSVFDSFIVAQEQFIFQRALQLAGVLLNPLLCLPWLLSGFGSVAVVSMTAVVTLLKLALNFLFCVRRLHTPIKFGYWDRALLKEISGFSFFLFLNMLIDQINWSVDQLILGRITGTAAVAIYGVGSQINGIVLNFSTIISSVFAPRVNRIAAQEKDAAGESFTKLFIRIGRIQFLVLGLVVSGFVFFGKYFVTTFYAGKEYVTSYYVALWLIIPVTIPLIQNLGIEIQRAVNKHRFRSSVYLIMAVANVAVSIPLAARYGPVGCAVGTAVSLLLANGLIMNIYYYKAIGIDILAFWRSILRLARGLAIPIILGLVIQNYIPFRGVWDFVLWVLIYTAVYMISCWLVGMNGEEKAILARIFSKRRDTAV